MLRSHFVAQSTALDFWGVAASIFFWLAVIVLVVAMVRKKGGREKELGQMPPLRAPPSLPGQPVREGRPYLTTVALGDGEAAIIVSRLLAPTYLAAAVAFGMSIVFLFVGLRAKERAELFWTSFIVFAVGMGFLAVGIPLAKRRAREAFRAECLVTHVGRIGTRVMGQARFPATLIYNFRERPMETRHQSVPAWFLSEAAKQGGRGIIVIEGKCPGNVLLFDQKREPPPLHRYAYPSR